MHIAKKSPLPPFESHPFAKGGREGFLEMLPQLYISLKPPLTFNGEYSDDTQTTYARKMSDDILRLPDTNPFRSLRSHGNRR
jgi:hypothetical protein